ncbi:dihydropteroate synthase [Pedobacter antarcticus 4BY]|uniref:dihydropteroate synthase n=2 Tax=Pedobacter antarcticus TaxID=34086 RepID=A0A081PE58_9SPHI|nr:dihydropteroate synthase [Pedobacter antarcticus 4BY]SFF45997.1 Dihydropteroate synthase [Pedobacter antarcticus]
MAKDTFLNRKITLNIKGELFDLSTPCVMGILNLTPDSFFGESRIGNVDAALKRVEICLLEGARFIDLGAYSSRPGAADVSTDEELKRIIPVIEAIVREFPHARLSIDTFRSKVAAESIHAGAHLINDISGGTLDKEMFSTVAGLGVPYILMHMKGTPQDMQNAPEYAHVGLDVIGYFAQKISELQALGVQDIILDPGFGFAKTLDHNYQLLNYMHNLDIFGLPVLTGISRKSMIYKLLGTQAEEALNGTTVINTIALLKGTSILRVHDVRAAMECIQLVGKMQAS